MIDDVNIEQTSIGGSVFAYDEILALEDDQH